MKKILLIGLSAIALVVAGYGYLWYRNKSFPYKYRSETNKICEEKCRLIYREDLKKCSGKCDNYVSGNPVYAFNSELNRCLYKAEILGDNYYDAYIKDCNTNEYVTRWNPTPEELQQGNSQIYIIMEKNRQLFGALMGNQGEAFLLGR